MYEYIVPHVDAILTDYARMCAARPQPADPEQAVESCRGYLARCIELENAAQTHEARALAAAWRINAENELLRWIAQLERSSRR